MVLFVYCNYAVISKLLCTDVKITHITFRCTCSGLVKTIHYPPPKSTPFFPHWVTIRIFKSLAQEHFNYNNLERWDCTVSHRVSTQAHHPQGFGWHPSERSGDVFRVTAVSYLAPLLWTLCASVHPLSLCKGKSIISMLQHQKAVGSLYLLSECVWLSSCGQGSYQLNQGSVEVWQIQGR